MNDGGVGRHRLPTLDDVAALAGVGRGTVSRVVNGAPHVSEDAAARVLAAIEQLGYVPNKAARSLVTRRAETVTLVISESEERVFTEPFFAAVVRGISAALVERSRPLLLAMAQTVAQHESLEQYLLGQHVDGVMLLSLHGDAPLLGELERRGLPTVIGGRPPHGEDLSFVDVDNVAGGFEATTHLLDRGRRCIAIITGPPDMAVSADRLQGYRDALTQRGVDVDEDLVVAGDFTETGGQAAMSALLDRAPHLDAVFASSDLMASGAVRALLGRGLRVPEDVAVVGFDDAPVARHTEPQLTTMHQPVEQMGRSMVELLVARIEGRPTENHVMLAPHLVVRASS
jgi:DNA-binding LacI/PurR family transcriptional regulator